MSDEILSSIMETLRLFIPILAFAVYAAWVITSDENGDNKTGKKS